MKQLRVLFLIAPLLLLSAAVAKADTISGSGTWGDGAPTTDESAPGDTWSFSFVVSDPATDATPLGSDAFTTEEISDFSFSLDGTPITATLTSVTFYDTTDSGMFDLDLSNGDVVSLYGAQVFNNFPPDPTFAGGTYPVQIAMDDASAEGTGSVTIMTAPEPGSLALLGLGMLAIGLVRKRIALV